MRLSSTLFIKKEFFMDSKLNPMALGSAAALIAGFTMLTLGILGNLGIYTGAAEQMQQWHFFFSLSIWGIILGISEAAVTTFVLAYIFGWLYNRFLTLFNK